MSSSWMIVIHEFIKLNVFQNLFKKEKTNKKKNYKNLSLMGTGRGWIILLLIIMHGRLDLVCDTLTFVSVTFIDFRLFSTALRRSNRNLRATYIYMQKTSHVQMNSKKHVILFERFNVEYVHNKDLHAPFYHVNLSCWSFGKQIKIFSFFLIIPGRPP